MKTSHYLILLLTLLFASADTAPISAQESEWELVFCDEFNQPNGSQPDPAKWNAATRNPSTWARWISSSPRVAYIKNGALICRAIPNKWEPTDTAKMLTGAVNTREKFEFQYGKVEVRMKTNLTPSNFPAIWMSKSSKQKPQLYGEIDIAEVVQKKVSHNIHSQYTQTHPKHGMNTNFSKTIDVQKWHIYGIIWTPTQVVWTIDEQTTGIYKKPTDKKLLDEGAWTFDHPFFLILNQSLGTGRWKSLPYPDTRKTFETKFDWVRVYQRKTPK